MAVYQDLDDMQTPFFFRLVSDKRACAQCLNDKGLLKFLKYKISSNANRCSYCHNTSKTVDIDELQQYILEFFPYADADGELPLAYLKEDPGMWHDSHDTLEMFIGSSVCDEIFEDFSNHLVDARYCQWNWASLTPTEQRRYQWEEFREIVRYKNGDFRLCSSTAAKERNHDELDPSDFYQALAAFLCRADALSILPSESVIHRVHLNHLRDDELNFSRLTSPPSHAAGENRFSPEKESMFYGAKDFDTACLEVRAADGMPVTHAVFKTKRDLCLVDFTAIRRPDGKFDYEWLGDYHISEFLNGFLADIRKEVKDKDDNAYYVPTQAICRYFKTQGAKEILTINLNNPDLPTQLQFLAKTNKIDGFCYHSSKGIDRTCYVLFCDNEGSAEMLELLSPNRTIFQSRPSIEDSCQHDVWSK